MLNFSTKLFAIFAAMMVAVFPFSSLAATVTDASDQPSSLLASAASNHKISVTIASGVDEGDTLNVTFAVGFTTTSITEDDVDIADDGVDLSTAATCAGSEQMSVAMSSNVLTFTACAGDGGAIVAGSVVTIEVGLNASSSGTSSNRITNPSTAGTYFITVAGTFGDEASIPVPIVSDDNTGVTATVPASGGDGGGGGGGGGGGVGDGGSDAENPDPTPDPTPDPDPAPEPVPEPDPEPEPTPEPDTDENGPDAPVDSGTSGGSSGSVDSGGIDVVDDEGTSTDSGGSKPEPDDEEPIPNDDEQDIDDEPEPEPEPEEEVPTVSTPGRVAQAVTSIAASIQDAFQEIREIPVVQDAAEAAVPVVAVTAVASTVVLANSFGLLPYLHYLVTSPILFFWRRKRKNFGIVYNAVTKVAVDLATVRLFDAKTNRLLRSAVTDSEGKYFFIMPPGVYKLAVAKTGFVSPSTYLAGMKDDGAYLDVYTGQELVVEEKDATVAANIPLDPQQTTEPVSATSLKWRRVLRMGQYGVAVAGVIVSTVAYAFAPSTIGLVMVAVQVIVFAFAYRLAKPRRPKGWGIVYDKRTQQPVGNAVVRLFEPKYNKLVETALTDSYGRYSFVLGANEYYASYGKKGYKDLVVRPIDYRDRTEPTPVSVDVPLEREEGV